MTNDKERRGKWKEEWAESHVKLKKKKGVQKGKKRSKHNKKCKKIHIKRIIEASVPIDNLHSFIFISMISPPKWTHFLVMKTVFGAPRRRSCHP